MADQRTPRPSRAWSADRRSLTGILAALMIIVGATQASADSKGMVSGVKEFFNNAPAPAPEEVLSAYFEAQKSGNFEAAYGLLSTADRAFRSKDEYEKAFGIGGALAQAMTYKVQSVKLDGLKAVITVENTHPDVTAIIGPILAMALTGGDDEAKGKVRKAVIEKLASGNFPTATTVFTKTLIKEADEWRVYEGLEVKSRATRLLEEGEQLARAKKYESAENRFEQVANIPGDAVKDEREKGRKELAETEAKASKELAETEAKAEKEQRKQAYLKRLKLYDFETGLYDTYGDKRVPGVKFKLKNEGDLTLSRVEVTVYFKDATGKTIHEQSFVPVFVNSFGLDNRGPLKPGYIWELERGNFYAAKSVPTEWKPGAAEARITDLDFSE